MALGVKESVSGRRYPLTVDGDEVRVCAGKGAVYLSGPKVALRCCGKTSIVATRKMKQSVLRQGDVLLLGLRDHFYANGTLTKYEVVDMDAQPVKTPLTVLPTRVPSITMSSAASSRPMKRYGAPPTGTRLVSSYFSKVPLSPPPRSLPANSMKANKHHESPAAKAAVEAAKRSLESSSKSSSSLEKVATAPKVVDLDESTGSSTAEEEEEEELAPTKRRRGKRSRAIVESDGDEEDEADITTEDVNVEALAVDSDVSSPGEDGHKTSGSAARDWMAAFGRGAKKLKTAAGQTTLDGWETSRSGGWKDKRKSKQKDKQRVKSRDLERVSHEALDTYGDESEDDEHYTRTHDEVGQLLEECENIARKLRRSVSSWAGNSRQSATSSPSSSPNVSGDEEEVAGDEQMSLATIAAGNGRRVIAQTDIPEICETLELKPYQVVGVNWLLLLYDHNVSGVLADEMGLGKTVQTISFLLLLQGMAKEKSKNSGGPHLVVVPASVLNNWKREFAWIAPKMRVVTYHGSIPERRLLEDSLSNDSFDVMLTTYTYFERDSCQEERAFLRSYQFNYMILDEGHSIKNSASSRFRRITALRVRTRLVLSGTPIQNNLNELLALLSFLMPRMFDHGSDELLAFFDGNQQTKCAKVRKILAPFILRREKKYVLNQLVPKKEVVEFVKLSEDQRKAYSELVEGAIRIKENKAARKQQQKEWKAQIRAKGGKVNNQVRDLLGYTNEGAATPLDTEQSPASLFTELRKAANHPVLLRRIYKDEDTLATMSMCLHRAEAFGNQCSIEMVRRELETYSDFDLHDLCVQYGANEQLRQLQLPTETLLASAKFKYLRELLPKLRAEGHRVLIFSQWTKLLDLMEELMHHMEYQFLRLDGSTVVSERQDLIDKYNEDKNIFVFLLSTRAGGLGINLTAADTVILHDLDCNPTADEQACDRCHRIGQTKPVTIYRLVAEDTVDHAIYKIGQSKTELNHAVLDKLNAYHGKSKKKGNILDRSTVEMLLASVIETYKEEKASAGECQQIAAGDVETEK